jgi:copper(I)-binding protein
MDAWARTSAPGAPSAGFMTVMNHGAEDDVLIDVRGNFAKKLELHRTQKVDGVMKMIHQMNGIVIPAGGTVVFKPGDYHLMFMGLKKNFEKGETYNVTLVFKKAGEINVALPVREAPAMQMGNHEHKH